MDAADTVVYILSIVDGMSLLFLTVYFVSLNIHKPVPFLRGPKTVEP